MLESFINIWESIINQNEPVVVEGKRDVSALKRLGFKGDIIKLNDGKSVLSTVEQLVQTYGPGSGFIVMMDWDRTGNKLAMQLKKYGESCDMLPNLIYRQKLSTLYSKDISSIEELPSFIRMLEMNSGNQNRFN